MIIYFILHVKQAKKCLMNYFMQGFRNYPLYCISLAISMIFKLMWLGRVIITFYLNKCLISIDFISFLEWTLKIKTYVHSTIVLIFKCFELDEVNSLESNYTTYRIWSVLFLLLIEILVFAIILIGNILW